jgi:hypothetical protein
MQIKIIVTEETFNSGDVLREKVDPPVIEFSDKDGWIRRAKLDELDKFSQFTGANKSFLMALKHIVDTLSSMDKDHE